MKLCFTKLKLKFWWTRSVLKVSPVSLFVVSFVCLKQWNNFFLFLTWVNFGYSFPVFKPLTRVICFLLFVLFWKQENLSNSCWRFCYLQLYKESKTKKKNITKERKSKNNRKKIVCLTTVLKLNKVFWLKTIM